MPNSYYNSPLGWLEIETNNNELTALRYIVQPPEKKEVTNPINLEIEKQLTNYFTKKPIKNSFKMSPEGTPFQQKIWALLSEIKPGKTQTYLEIARRFGNKKAIRAVGSAIGKNPIMIFIPCHRVIGSDGTMVGYAGGIPNKKWLLEHEGFLIQKNLNL